MNRLQLLQFMKGLWVIHLRGGDFVNHVCPMIEYDCNAKAPVNTIKGWLPIWFCVFNPEYDEHLIAAMEEED